MPRRERQDLDDFTACEVCGKTNDADVMLLCGDGSTTGCGLAYHTFCLNPSLPRAPLPEGDWFCEFCIRDGKNKPWRRGSIKKMKKSAKTEEDKEHELLVKDSLTAANEAAKSMIGKATLADVEKLLVSIEHWPTQTRPNVAPDPKHPDVSGLCFGLVPNRSSPGAQLSLVSRTYPHLCELLAKFVASTIEDKAFPFGSLQVNYNYQSRKHIDGNNLGPSHIMSLGDHTCGRLWTGDQGFVGCHRKWKKFDGNVQHGTEDFEGTRVSLIAFTPASYHVLESSIYTEVRRLGFTAGATDGKEDPYFKNYRDLGTVDEAQFDEYVEARRRERLPPGAPGSVMVECNGYAAGRGSGIISFQASAGGGQATIAKEQFRKNHVGIHVLSLKMGADRNIALHGRYHFNLYKDTAKESRRWANWVDRLPAYAIIAICITDTAMAKTRPLPEEVYEALRQLGAPDELSVIGYRQPFAFVGVKDAPKGSAAWALDTKVKCKTMLRIEATLVTTAAGGVAVEKWHLDQTALLDHLDDAGDQKPQKNY